MIEPILYDSPRATTPLNGSSRSSSPDDSLPRIDSPVVDEAVLRTHFSPTEARQGWWKGLISRFQRSRPKFPVEKDARKYIADVLKNYLEDNPNDYPQDPDERTAVHEVLRILRKAFGTGIHGEANNLRDKRAQIAMDIMQGILSDIQHRENEADPIIEEAGWLLRRRLQKLACEASVLPTQMFLENVHRQDFLPYGIGGFADVYRGTFGDQNIAIKHLRVLDMVRAARKSAVRKLLYREAVLWYNVNHVNILTFKGVSKSIPQLEGLSFILHWAEYMDLARYLDRLRTEGLSGMEYVNKVNGWLFDIARALRYIHRYGIVHGDLRAANVLIDWDEVPLLADFGLAVISDIGISPSEPLTSSATAWMAPELINPPSEYDKGTRATSYSDMYSFGCLCVELYQNSPPFGGMKNPQIINHVTGGERPSRPPLMGDSLWKFVTKCFRARPKARPTAEEAVQVFSLLI